MDLEPKKMFLVNFLLAHTPAETCMLSTLAVGEEAAVAPCSLRRCCCRILLGLGAF